MFLRSYICKRIKKAKVTASAYLGWGFWVMMISTGMIGKFFGLIGSAVFLGVSSSVQLLISTIPCLCYCLV